MNKVKILFFMIFFLIFAVSLFFLNSFHVPINSKIDEIPEFQITRISENGTVYKNLAMTDPVHIKKLNYSGEIFLKADAQTTFEFFFNDTFFIASPESSLYYHLKTKELYLNGDFFWHKELKTKKVEIYYSSEDRIKDLYDPRRMAAQSPESRTDQPENTIFILSDSGRVKAEENFIKIWSYSGDFTLVTGNESRHLNSKQMLEYNKKSKAISIVEVLPAPEFITPEKKTIQLNLIGQSIIKFGWKNVAGATQYILRLYPSSLRDSLLLEKYLNANRKSIDILKFENENEIFWEVYPYDADKKIEGAPSSMGEIKIIGVLFDKEKLLQPPKLEINSLTVSGNMVLIKGEADANSQLYINEEYVKIDMDGKFIHTITFKTIGTKTITFKLISPSEIETSFERQVAIFEE
jgi:hypothetical protein